MRDTLDLTPITVVGCLPNAHFPADLRYGHLPPLHKVKAPVQLLHKPRQPRRIIGVPACQHRKVGKHSLPVTCRSHRPPCKPCQSPPALRPFLRACNKASCCITSARTVPRGHAKGNASLSLIAPTLPSAIQSAIPSAGGTRNLSMTRFFSTCPAEDAKNPVSLQTEQYRIFVCFQPMMSANAVTSKVCKFQAAL